MDRPPPNLSAVIRRQAPAAALASFFLAALVVAPARLKRLAVEDGPVEWLTVGACLAAAAAFGARARSSAGQDRLGTALAAAFCLFVAGEEISWGERLVGFIPPEVFLRENVQQEFSIHNVLQALFKPKWMVVGLLASWGLCLPVALRTRWAGRVPPALREPAPPLELAPWAALGAALMVVYPVDFTGEYVELLTGLLLLETSLAAQAADQVPFSYAAAILVAAAGSLVTDIRPFSRAEVLCAEAEVKALAAAAAAEALDGPKAAPDSLDKRMYRAAEEGYLRRLPLSRAMEAAACPDDPHAALRRTYLIDPWGQPYRLRLEPSEDGDDIAEVYSAGPNRRLDDGDDDIRASAPLSGEGGVFLDL